MEEAAVAAAAEEEEEEEEEEAAAAGAAGAAAAEAAAVSVNRGGSLARSAMLRVAAERRAALAWKATCMDVNWASAPSDPAPSSKPRSPKLRSLVGTK